MHLGYHFIIFCLGAYSVPVHTQVFNTSLPELLQTATSGTLQLQAGTYNINTNDSAYISTNLTIEGQVYDGGTPLSTLDLSPYDYLNARSLIIEPGVTLQLRNLVIRLPRLHTGIRSLPFSLISHFAVKKDARVLVHKVTLITKVCSDFENFMRYLCDGWKYNTTGLQLLGGVAYYGAANMALSSFNQYNDDDRQAAAAGAVLTETRVVCPDGGMPAPWVCSSTYVSSYEEFRARVMELLPNTSEQLALSLTANITLNPATWQPMNLRNLSTYLYGDPTRQTILDFAGIAGAFYTQSSKNTSVALLKNLTLRGLPYSPAIISPLDYFALWVHSIRAPRIKRASPVVKLDNCQIVVGRQEFNYLATIFGSTPDANSFQRSPWLSPLFLGGVVSSLQTGYSITLTDASQTVKIESCTLVRFNNTAISSASDYARRDVPWPLGRFYRIISSAAAIASSSVGLLAVANDSVAGPFLADKSFNRTSFSMIATAGLEGAVVMTAVNASRDVAARDLGPQYLLVRDTALYGAPVMQTGRATFWDMKGVTGELRIPQGARVNISDVVMYNLVPGGALPYGAGFGSVDVARRLLAYGVGWTANDSLDPPSGDWEGLANLTLPLWYFAKPSSGLPATTLQIASSVLVLPRVEFDLLVFLLRRGGKLPAAARSPPGANTTSSLLSNSTLLLAGRRRAQQTDTANGTAATQDVVLPMKADAQLQQFVSNAQVSWYTNEALYLSSVSWSRWTGAEIIITHVLPPGAPTALLQYDVTYDPIGYPPPSPNPPLPPSLEPPSPRPPPSPQPPLSPQPQQPTLDTETFQPPSSPAITASIPQPAPQNHVIGIAVGTSVPVVLLILTAMCAFFLIRRRYGRAWRRSHHGSGSSDGRSSLTKSLRAGRDALDSLEEQAWGTAAQVDDNSSKTGVGGPQGSRKGAGKAPGKGADNKPGKGPRVLVSDTTVFTGATSGYVTTGSLPISGPLTDTLAPSGPGGMGTGRRAGAETMEGGNGGGGDPAGVFPAVGRGADASGMQNAAESGLEQIQQAAASAATPEETMALLAAAASGSVAQSGTFFSALSQPSALGPSTGMAQLQLVLVEDEELLGCKGQGRTGLLSGKASRNVQAGGEAAADGGEAHAHADGAAAATVAGVDTRGVGAGGGDGTSRVGGSAALRTDVSLNLGGGGKSLLQTMDIESALQAYSSRSQIPNDDKDPTTSTRPLLQDSPASGPARAGGDLAAAINSLQAELSGRQEQLRITTVLGKGSFGIVYLGTWRGLRVAVKILVVHDALLGSEGRRRQRAILEAAISTSLHHPNVVSTYAFDVKPLGVIAAPPQARPDAGGGTDDDGGGVPPEAQQSVWEAAGDVYKLYIIQEYCDVGTLRDALSSGVVGSVAAGGAAALCALTLSLDVACGMCHIHGKNIVHGDLSSANILLTTLKPGALPGSMGSATGPTNVWVALAETMALGRPVGARSLAAQVSRLRGLWRPSVVAKVADFGLSVRMVEGQTHASNKFQGTPLYSAPEVLNRGHLTKASDVFSYGVMLLEFFYGSHISEVKARRGAALPEAGGPTASLAGGRFGVAMPASCPPHLRNLMIACISQEPTTRPTFEQIVDSLVELLMGEHLSLQQQQQQQY